MSKILKAIAQNAINNTNPADPPLFCPASERKRNLPIEEYQTLKALEQEGVKRSNLFGAIGLGFVIISFLVEWLWEVPV